MRLFGEIARKSAFELFALADVDGEYLVGRAGLFEHHRDFVTIRRGPIMQIDHQYVPSFQARTAAILIIDGRSGHAVRLWKKCHDVKGQPGQPIVPAAMRS